MRESRAGGWIRKHERFMTVSYAFLFVLLIVAPTLLVKISDGVDRSSSGQAGGGNPLVFLPPGSVSAPSDEIYEWVRLRNPFQRLMPDCRFGFAEVLPAYGPRIVPQPGDETIAPMPLVTRDLLGMPGLAEGKDENVLLQKQLAYIDVSFPVKKSISGEYGAFWINEEGHVMKNGPKIELAAIRQAVGVGPRNQVIRSSRICLEPSGGGEPVRLVVRRSCGNTELDRYAVAAMREYLVKTALPAAVPTLPAGGIVLEVIWKIPPEL